MGKFKEGRYIAIYEEGGIYTNDVWGKVIASTENDGYTTYTLLRADGTTCEVSDKKRKVSSYDDYFSHLNSDAFDWRKSIDVAEETLKEVLGESFKKAPEIADQCDDRRTPFEIDEQVIMFRIDNNYCYFQEYERGTVTKVEFPEYYKDEPYYLKKDINGSFCIPVYTISTTYGTTHVVGHDWNFSHKFIGTQDEFIRFLVNDIKLWLKQLQTIEITRGELYNEIKDNPNEETLHMRHPIEIRDPFGDQKTM